MIQVYADNKGIKSLERACQGYIEALRDIENHVIGQDESRVHEEELGRALCQADNQQQSWYCAGRFVYGMDAQKQKALCVGYIDDHYSPKGKNDYRNLRKVARKTKNSDFNDKIFVSSEQILQQTQSVANEMIPPQNDGNGGPDLSRMEILEMEYSVCAEMGKEGLDYFREILKTSLTENGPITTSEQKIIRRRPKDDSFSIEIEKVLNLKRKVNLPQSVYSP